MQYPPVCVYMYSKNGFNLYTYFIYITNIYTTLDIMSTYYTISLVKNNTFMYPPGFLRL